MKLKDLKNVISFRGERKIACGSCGAEFGCEVSLRGCWCTNVKLSRETLQELRANFSDCLCPACLEKYEMRSRIDLTPPETLT